MRLTWSIKNRDGEDDLAEALARVGFVHQGEYPWLTAVELDKALRAYQQDAGLAADGICGPKTWAALDADKPCGQPVAPVSLRPEILRINSLLVPEVWNQCGYYSMTSENEETQEYLIRKAGMVQRTAAKLAGRKATHGMTCGHFADYFAKLYLGTEQPRVRHTGMNLTAFWKQRDAVVSEPSSTVGAGLFAGMRTVDAGTWSPRVHGCAGQIVADNPAIKTELQIVEYGSHIICRLIVAADSGIVDPRTGMLARPGAYRVGADGSKSRPGTPWTFRKWREGDADGVRPLWSVRTGVASARDIQAWLEV